MPTTTLTDYIQECGLYAFRVMQLDKNAPSTNDINKMVSIMASETTLDRLDFMKAVVERMEKDNIPFNEAIRTVRDENKKET